MTTTHDKRMRQNETHERKLPVLANTRGQLVGHVFVFILGLFVVAGVLLIGYRAVNSVQENRCAVQQATFVDDLTRAFDTNLARGKTRVVGFSLPCGSDSICFVSRTNIDSKASTPTIDGTSAVIAASVASGEQTNVFVRDTGGYRPLTTIGRTLPVESITDSGGDPVGIICFDGDSPEIQFNGKGNTIDLKAAPAGP